MANSFCWIKPEKPCGKCLGCYWEWLYNDPMHSEYWERQKDAKKLQIRVR